MADEDVVHGAEAGRMCLECTGDDSRRNNAERVKTGIRIGTRVG